MYKIMKIYFDNITGERLWDASYNHDTIVDFDHDYEVVHELNIRTKEFVGLLILENGAYAQDFTECNGYRVNVETVELEFSYPDPNNPEAPQVFQRPLTDQIADLHTELKSTQDTLDFLLLG